MPLRQQQGLDRGRSPAWRVSGSSAPCHSPAQGRGAAPGRRPGADQGGNASQWRSLWPRQRTWLWSRPFTQRGRLDFASVGAELGMGPWFLRALTVPSVCGILIQSESEILLPAPLEKSRYHRVSAAQRVNRLLCCATETEKYCNFLPPKFYKTFAGEGARKRGLRAETWIKTKIS